MVVMVEDMDMATTPLQVLVSSFLIMTVDII